MFLRLVFAFSVLASGGVRHTRGATSAAPAPASVVVPKDIPPITSVAAAAARWPQLSSDDEPIELTGVVTATMPSGAFRLHDGEMSIYATRSASVPHLQAGEKIKVSGVLRKEGFSPWMTPLRVERLGTAEFPEPKPASFTVLASGEADNQWVEIEGVVRGVDVRTLPDYALLDLGMVGGTMRVLVNLAPGDEFASLVDAAVKLRGVAAVNVNRQKHVVEPSFRVPRRALITVVRPAPADAFAKPLVPAMQVMRYSLGGGQGHRIRTRGVVTRQLTDRTFFVRDETIGLKVESATPVTLRPGELVEVAGFPVVHEGMAVLQQAISRVVATEAAPQPAEPSLQTLRDGSLNSDLVNVRARLVDTVSTGESVTLVLQTGDQVFQGLMNLKADAVARLPAKNSLVSVTGICAISELEDVWFYQPRSFLLLVADLADVTVVRAPTWWTPERLRFALLLTGAVLLAAAGWVWLLRRQIERKRAVIEQQARHAAALEERSRIARELHDTLEQGLTGLSLQMKAMETDLAGADHPVRPRLQAARQMLRQSRALARNAIRDMRTEAVRLDGLVEGLRRVARSWNNSGALTVTVEVLGIARALPPRVEHHLLGIGTEAMTNAVKHGRAEQIRIEVEFRTGEIAVRITDNGVGFDPDQQLEQGSGCFGLIGMRERAREVRGNLRFTSHPGEGTVVTVTAPAPIDASANTSRPVVSATASVAPIARPTTA